MDNSDATAVVSRSVFCPNMDKDVAMNEFFIGAWGVTNVLIGCGLANGRVFGDGHDEIDKHWNPMQILILKDHITRKQ